MSQLKAVEGHVKEQLRAAAKIPSEPPTEMEQFLEATKPIRGEKLSQQTVTPKYVTQNRFSQDLARAYVKPEDWPKCFNTITFLQLEVNQE